MKFLDKYMTIQSIIRIYCDSNFPTYVGSYIWTSDKSIDIIYHEVLDGEETGSYNTKVVKFSTITKWLNKDSNYIDVFVDTWDEFIGS